MTDRFCLKMIFLSIRPESLILLLSFHFEIVRQKDKTMATSIYFIISYAGKYIFIPTTNRVKQRNRISRTVYHLDLTLCVFCYHCFALYFANFSRQTGCPGSRLATWPGATRRRRRARRCCISGEECSACCGHTSCVRPLSPGASWGSRSGSDVHSVSETTVRRHLMASARSGDWARPGGGWCRPGRRSGKRKCCLKHENLYYDGGF